MKSIQKVIVSIDFGSQELQVGELIKEGRGIYFKYYTEFIKTGFELSPFHLPLNDSIYKAPAQPFEGLFGVAIRNMVFPYHCVDDYIFWFFTCFVF
jgi:serine/threonine-protein kinase HipA